MSTQVPLPLKLIFTAFMAVLIPAYWINYGPANFLWISDISLMLAFLAVITENKWFASMAAIEGLVLESFWTISFVLALGFDIHLTDIADYMLDSTLPLWLRLLSLFHLFLPPLFIWLVRRLGYVRKAVFIQIPFTWVLLGVTWLLTQPAKDINWVFDYQKLHLNAFTYLVLEGLGIAVIFFLTHRFLVKITQRLRVRANAAADKN